MRALLIIAAFSISLLTTAKEVKQTRDVCCFSGVEIAGAYEVFLRMGEESSITIVADEDIINSISTSVEDDVLEVDFDEDDWWDMGKNGGSAKLYITFKTVRYLELSGACVVKSKNSLRGTNVEIEGSGACKLDLDFDCSSLEIEFSGATKATLGGKCGKVIIDASGASAIYAADLQTKSMSMDLSGASKAEVYVTERLSVEASGASKVRYKGSPSISKDVSGASSISKL